MSNDIAPHTAELAEFHKLARAHNWHEECRCSAAEWLRESLRVRDLSIESQKKELAEFRKLARHWGWSGDGVAAEHLRGFIRSTIRSASAALEAENAVRLELAELTKQVEHMEDSLAKELPHSRELLRLSAEAAKVPELLDLLKELEWSGMPYGRSGSCPVCYGDHPTHIANCKLSAALAATEPQE